MPDEFKDLKSAPDPKSPLFDRDIHDKLRPWIYGIGIGVCALVILVYRLLDGSL